MRFSRSLSLFLIFLSLFPLPLFATNMGGIAYIVLWMFVDFPMFLLYILQLGLALFFLRREKFNLFIKILNIAFLIFGVIFGIPFVIFHGTLILSIPSESPALLEASVISALISVLILILGVFSTWYSFKLAKKSFGS